MQHRFTYFVLCGAGLIGVAGCPDSTTVDRDAGPGEMDAGRPVDAGPPGCGDTLGLPCTTGVDCDDGCFCDGEELCIAGRCAAGAPPACDDGAACTADTCSEEGAECVHAADDSVCDDGDPCNGAETCVVAVGCRAGAELECTDDDPCTVDGCEPGVGCSHEPRDLDGDGYVDADCGGDDCDDDPRTGAARNPGAVEDCSNRRDDDCDGDGDFEDPDCAPDNDTCDSAQALPGPGTYSATTVGLADDLTVECRPSGIDAVFTFTTDAPADATISLAGGGVGAAIALRRASDCATGPDLRCGAALGGGASVRVRDLPAGEWIVVVETPSELGFELTLALEPPTPVPATDACTAGTVDVSAGGTFEGDFGDVADDYRLSCSALPGAVDAAYRLVLDDPADVTLTTSFEGGFFGTGNLALVTDCGDPDTAVRCRTGAGATTVRGLPAGTYWVLLEPGRADVTGWTLDVTIEAPAPRGPGDACETAIDIRTAAGRVDVATLEPDGGTSCGGGFPTQRDAFFTFEITRSRDVEVTTTAPGFHWMSLSTVCGEHGSELRCVSGSSPSVQTFRSLDPGVYFVTVATSLMAGVIDASIVRTAPTPPPPNDTCAGAEEVGAGFSGSGTLAGYADDARGCGLPGPDAFYSLTLAARKRVSVLASVPGGGATDRITLTLRDGCADGVSRGCDTGNPAALAQTLDPGAYVLIVEQAPASAGPYDLTVLVEDP